MSRDWTRHPEDFSPAPVHVPTEIFLTGIGRNLSIDELFTITCVYADVLRIEMSSSTGSAWLEVASESQAERAAKSLHGLQFRDSELRASVLQVSSGRIPSSDAYIRDFSGSSLHRFRGGLNSRNEKHVCPPSSSLHISNLADAVDESILSAFLSSPDFQVSPTSIQFVITHKRRMAFVHLSSVSQAIDALIRCHAQVLCSRDIRISFSHAMDRSMHHHQPRNSERVSPPTSAVAAHDMMMTRRFFPSNPFNVAAPPPTSSHSKPSMMQPMQLSPTSIPPHLQFNPYQLSPHNALPWHLPLSSLLMPMQNSLSPTSAAALCFPASPINVVDTNGQLRQIMPQMPQW